MEVDDDAEDEEGGEQVRQVRQVRAVEGLSQRAHLVVSSRQQVEQRDYRPLELRSFTDKPFII